MKLLTIVALFLCASLSALAADATGSWKISFETPNGKRESVLALKQDGDKLTGNMKSEQMPDTPITGTAAGDSLTFSITRDFNGQTMKIEYSAKVDGDKMSGNVKFGEMGEAPFTGEKQK